MTQPTTVKAHIKYIQPGPGRPVYVASQAGADAALTLDRGFDGREVTIHNGRELSPPATLDVQGFSIVQHATRVPDFYAFEAAREAYEEEIGEIVLFATGGKSVQVFDHTLRSDSADVRGARSIREPASVIHNDYTDSSAEKRLREVLPADKVEQYLGRRYAIVNLWRSISGPVINSPLALCDYSSASDSDFIATERRATDRTGELELVTYSPSHRWYFFPEQQFDEAVLIKTFDSAREGVARRAAHTAFDNPQASADAPPRESIESRLFVFY